MTAIFKGKHMGQADEFLVNGKVYTDKDLKWLIEQYSDELIKHNKLEKAKKKRDK